MLWGINVVGRAPGATTESTIIAASENHAVARPIFRTVTQFKSLVSIAASRTNQPPRPPGTALCLLMSRMCVICPFRTPGSTCLNYMRDHGVGRQSRSAALPLHDGADAGIV